MTLKTMNDVATYVCEEMLQRREKKISFVSTIQNLNIPELYRAILHKAPELLLCIQGVSAQLLCLGTHNRYTLTVEYSEAYPSFVRFVDSKYQVNNFLLETAVAHRKNDYFVCRACDLDMVLAAIRSIVALPEYLNANVSGVQPSVLKRTETDYIGIKVCLTYSCDYRTARERTRRTNEEIKRIANLARAAGREDWKRAYAVVEYCVNNWEYERSSDFGLEYTSYGALVNKKAVCMGFSLAVCAIFKELGIPCRYVYGTQNDVGHAWNMIYVKGGWFYIDVTDAIGMRDPLYHWGVTHFDDGRIITSAHGQPLACHCDREFIKRFISGR